jgi:cellulose synthase/poly-beta-1,6-N-acetylglucosamine synthase-like glycosyltransferase
VALALIACGLFGVWCSLHPFTTYPLSLLLIRRFMKRPEQARVDMSQTGISLCMCAYNEEKVIEAKIHNLLALQRAMPNLELNVYVDAADDRTAEILQGYADKLRLIISSERKGKTSGMNRLVAQSTHPILMFTDANVTIDLAAPERILAHFSDPSVGCVNAHLSYVNANESVTAGTGSAYWRLEEWIKKLETQTGSAMGADGSLFAIRRELHVSPPEHIIDDMFVSLQILCRGLRVIQVEDVRAFERSATDSSEEFNRKVRISCQAFNVHRLMWEHIKQRGGLDLYKYISHKLMRWLTIYFLIGGLGLIAAGLVVLGYASLLVQLSIFSLVLLFLGAKGYVKPLAQIWDILSAFAGTGLGVLKSLTGTKFQTWSPATSIRK